jgi:hypothetical protein
VSKVREIKMSDPLNDAETRLKVVLENLNILQNAFQMPHRSLINESPSFSCDRLQRMHSDVTSLKNDIDKNIKQIHHILRPRFMLHRTEIQRERVVHRAIMRFHRLRLLGKTFVNQHSRDQP